MLLMTSQMEIMEVHWMYFLKRQKHIQNQICDRFIKHPSQAVAVGDVVKVVVLEVDEKKHRISLSMRQAAGKK